MMTREDGILKAITEADKLPTVPAVALEILRLSRDPRVSIEKVAETISLDPALAAKTLRFANSSFYGTSRPIVSLPQALVRIGMRGAKILALSFSLVDCCARGGGEFDFPAFWRRSLTTAAVARRMAKYTVRRLTDHVFIASLLADIGCPILARTFPQQYRSVERQYGSSLQSLDAIELRVLSMNHPEVGGLLLEAWQLPAELSKAVRVHHNISQAPPDSEAFTIAAVLMAASEISDIILRGPDKVRVAHLAELFRTYFSLAPAHIEAILTALEPEIQDVGHMLEVPLPPLDEIESGARAETLKLALSQPAAGGQKISTGAAR